MVVKLGFMMEDERTMDPLPKALRDLMERRNVNATALAAASGVTDSTVSLYLSGKRGKVIDDPDVLVTLEGFSGALDVPMTYWAEYRLLQIKKAFESHPDLERKFYKKILAYAADLEEESQGVDRRPNRGGPQRTRRERGGQAK